MSCCAVVETKNILKRTHPAIQDPAQAALEASKLTRMGFRMQSVLILDDKNIRVDLGIAFT